MSESKDRVARLRALAKEKRFRPVFVYLSERSLLSKATDIYSVKDKRFESTILKALLRELEQIGIGHFATHRSFNWGSYDLRMIGKMALSTDRQQRMDLMRKGASGEPEIPASVLALFDKDGKSEPSPINKTFTTTSAVDLSTVDLEDLLAEIRWRVSQNKPKKK